MNLMILGIKQSHRSGESYTQMLQRLGICGVLLRPAKMNRKFCREIVEQGIPAIVVGDRFDGGGVPSVYYETRDASRAAVDHLVGQGHNRIAFGKSLIEDFGQTERLSGYIESLENHGLAVDEKLILRVPASREGGAQIIRRIANSIDPPTAMYIADPLTAVGTMHEAQRMGIRVPDDLSIIGFDDSDLRYTMLPTMTAVCQDAIELGRESYRVLSGLISGESVQDVRPLSAWLEIHESAGPIAVHP